MTIYPMQPPVNDLQQICLRKNSHPATSIRSSFLATP